jgi:hypothetical protein
MSTNTDRASWAREAVATFTDITYGGRTPEELGAPTVDEGLGTGHAGSVRTHQETDAYTMISDLICDLGHYCRAIGLDWDDQVERAQRHLREEITLGWDEEG